MMNVNYNMFLQVSYIEYIIKKRETLTAGLPIHIVINGINNKLAFKIKEGCKLELQTPETMNLFRSKNQLIYETKKQRKRTKF